MTCAAYLRGLARGRDWADSRRRCSQCVDDRSDYEAPSAAFLGHSCIWVAVELGLVSDARQALGEAGAEVRELALCPPPELLREYDAGWRDGAGGEVAP